MWSKDFGTAEISFLIVSERAEFVKSFFRFFPGIFGNTSFEVRIMVFWKRAVLFCASGGAYVGLELLWRGYSHVSMFVAGGVCFLLIGQLGKVQPVLPWPVRALIGAGIITMVELATGLLVNRQYQVWDYRGRLGNFLGQICPAFTLLWIPVALLAMALYAWLDVRLDRLLGT